MAKIVSKGAVIKQDIASTLTAIAQCESFGSSGAGSESVKCSTLDTIGNGHEYISTGWAEGGTFDVTLQYDSELAGHQSLTDDITTPVERNYSVTLTGGTEMTFTAAHIELGFTGTIDDIVKADISLKLDQLIAYTT
jgi:hypothetical protein